MLHRYDVTLHLAHQTGWQQMTHKRQCVSVCVCDSSFIDCIEYMDFGGMTEDSHPSFHHFSKHIPQKVIVSTDVSLCELYIQ